MTLLCSVQFSFLFGEILLKSLEVVHDGQALEVSALRALLVDLGTSCSVAQEQLDGDGILTICSTPKKGMKTMMVGFDNWE